MSSFIEKEFGKIRKVIKRTRDQDEDPELVNVPDYLINYLHPKKKYSLLFIAIKNQNYTTIAAICKNNKLDVNQKLSLKAHKKKTKRIDVFVN